MVDVATCRYHCKGPPTSFEKLSLCTFCTLRPFGLLQGFTSEATRLKRLQRTSFRGFEALHWSWEDQLDRLAKVMPEPQHMLRLKEASGISDEQVDIVALMV